MTRLVTLCAVCAVVACSPPCEKPEPGPLPEVDAGPPPTLLRCQPLGVAPRTVPAGAAATVTLTLRCEGPDEPRAGTLAARARWADRTTSEFTRPVSFRAGDLEVPLELPAGQVAVGPRAVTFDVWAQSRVSAPIELRAPDLELTVAGHLPASTIAAQWDGVAPFDPAPPTMTAQRVDVLVRDVTGDDVLDALVVWRDGATLTFQTYRGPALMLTNSQTLTDPKVNVGTAPERVRFARRRGATSDRSGAVIWNAVDATPQEARVVIANLTDGAWATGLRVFDSMGLSRVERVLGTDVVFDATVMDGGAPELLLTFIGNEGGRRTFITAVTQALSGKLMVLSNVPAFDGVTPADVMGGAMQAGLTRSWKVSSLPTAAIDVGNVLAWVFVPAGTMRQSTVRRAAVSGPGAGMLTGGVVAWTPTMGEALLTVASTDADGDRSPDVVLVTRDDAGAAVRSFIQDLAGAVTSSRRVELTGVVLTPGEVSVWNSAQTPVTKGRCSAGSFWCGMTDHFLVVSGGSVAGVPVLAAVGEKAGLFPLSVPTRSQLGQASSSGAVRIETLPSRARPQGRLVFGRLLTDDEVVLSAHPNGVAVTLRGDTGGLGLTGIEAPTDFSSLRFTQPPWLVEDATSRGDTFVIVPTGTSGQDATWQVWLATATGLAGPSTWTVPSALGRFQPLALSAGSLDFARQDGARFEQLSVPMATARQLVRNGTARTFSGTDVKTFGGIDRPPLAREGVRVAQLRVRREAAFKQQQQQKWKSIGVGQDAVEGGTETIAVIGVDEADPCPYRTVLYPGDPMTTAPVTLSESTTAGCGDLDVPVVVGDVCGIGGQQVVTARQQPKGGGGSIWNFHVWLRGGSGIVRVEVGQLESVNPSGVAVAMGDVNGDGMGDLLLSVDGEPSVVFFNDGLGQSFGGASVSGFSDAVRRFPSAGPGLGGPQSACGAGLQCGLGIGTRNAASQANNKAELL